MTVHSRRLWRDVVRHPPVQSRVERHRALRQQVREGKLSLDEYLRVWIGVHPDYLDEVRPRFEREIFRH